MSGYKYKKIVDSFQKAISNGIIKENEKLPSTRKLSKSNNVSIGTVLQAYSVLEQRGYIVSKPQSGFYAKIPIYKNVKLPQMQDFSPNPVMGKLETLIANALDISRNSQHIPFGIAAPGPCLLPRENLRKIINKVSLEENIHRYHFPPGDIELRRIIAGRLLAAGCELGTENVIITSGCTESISLALKSITNEGDIVALESPSYSGHFQIIQALKLKALEIPSHPETGISLEHLESSLAKHKVKALIVSPHFSNPLGSVIPESNKLELIKLAEKFNFIIIENDIFSDLHFTKKRPKPLFAYNHNRVVLCSSISKTISPGLRVGWCVSKNNANNLTNLQKMRSLGISYFLQRVLALYYTEGGADKHLNNLRSTLKEQIERAQFLITEYFPKEVRFNNPLGGTVLWLQLPKDCDSIDLQEEAFEYGITIAPGSIFSMHYGYKNYIRLGFGHKFTPKLEEGLIKLGSLVNSK